MSLEAKITFLRELEKSISDHAIASDVPMILSTVSDVLQYYDITPRGGPGTLGSDDLFGAFISAMEIQGRSPKTIDRYHYIIQRLMDHLGVPTRSVTVYHLRSWLSAEKARGISDRTLDGDRQVFSAYFGWLWREGLIDRNPVVNLGPIKCMKKEKEVFSDIDLEKMNSGCSSLRDRAIIHFLTSTMCRISEVTQLNRDSVDFSSLECVVLGKGNKERIVYIDQVTGMLLSEYLATRMDDNPALFIGKRKERLQPGGVRAMLKTLSERTGVDHIHPHKFRRSKITSLVKRGMPIEQVRTLAGHEKLDTTMQYVVLDKTTVKNAYQKFA